MTAKMFICLLGKKKTCHREVLVKVKSKSSIWNPESIKEIKYRGKVEGKKICERIKNRFDLNKLILYLYLNSFYLFLSII